MGKQRGVARACSGGGLPCYNVYRTGDGRWMAVGALERKFWRTLCDILDACQELKGKHIVYGEEAKPVKERIAAALRLAHPARMVGGLRPRRLLREPRSCHRRGARQRAASRAEMVATDDGLTQARLPAEIHRVRVRDRTSGTAQREHTEEILREAGYRDAEIAALRGDGVI